VLPRLSWSDAALCIALWLISGLAHAASAEEELEKGRELFTGEKYLQGRIYTHRVDLPPAAVVCANCHSANDGPDVPNSRAPRLNHDLLLRPQPRRGGPASVYTREGFCAVLRRGVDPAFVLISVEMPRYTLQDADCQALWRYLIKSDNADTGA
jgi:hypothetical protein